MPLHWNGDRVAAKVRAASEAAINETMADAVIQAKQHHPGWQNRTGTAEGSVRIVQPATQGREGIYGEWGSVRVNYVIWLELKHGSFLRNAADHTYPALGKTIQKWMGRLGV